jgi:hypothetical protein
MLNIMLAANSPTIERLSKKTITNIPFRVFVVVVLWVILGTLFYKYYLNWTFYNSFFYAVQAGLSIGFGNITENNEDGTHVFTIFFVLLGSSIVSGSMGLFIQWITNEYLGSSQLVLSMKQFKLSERLSSNSTVGSTNENIYRTAKYLWLQFKILMGWYHNPTRTVICSLWGVWMLLGTLFWMYVEDENFISGLYFAITSCSTAGLYGPPCSHPSDSATPHCDLGMLNAIFIGLYVLVGVPCKRLICELFVDYLFHFSLFFFFVLFSKPFLVYAVTLGYFGTVALNYCLDHAEKELLYSPVTLSEFKFAAELTSEPGSTTLNKGEYVLLELMRLGRISRDDTLLIIEKFDKLDVSPRDGTLTINELLASGVIIENNESNYSFNIIRSFINYITT